VTTILLARHGETDWNAERRFQGHADPPLNETGRAQARALADDLAAEGVDAVYASDLRRARETAEIVAARAGAEVVVLPELREIDVGEWQGLTVADVEERYPEAIGRWRDGGNGWTRGETYDQLAERVLAALRRIAGDHPGGRVVVVGHGGTMRAVRAHAHRQELAEHRRTGGSIGNCEVFRLRAENGAFRID
jgi:broad specificity phosphatase PhoE